MAIILKIYSIFIRFSLSSSIIISSLYEIIKITDSATSFGFRNVLKSCSTRVSPIFGFMELGETQKVLTLSFFNSSKTDLENHRSACFDAQ